MIDNGYVVGHKYLLKKLKEKETIINPLTNNYRINRKYIMFNTIINLLLANGFVHFKNELIKNTRLPVSSLEYTIIGSAFYDYVLYFPKMRFTNKNMKYLKKLISHIPFLKIFSIKCIYYYYYFIDIMEEAIEEFSSLIANYQKLEELLIYRSSIGDKGMKCICNVIKTMKRLRKLSLIQCEFGNNGIRDLYNIFSNITNLESLYIIRIYIIIIIK